VGGAGPLCRRLVHRVVQLYCFHFENHRCWLFVRLNQFRDFVSNVRHRRLNCRCLASIVDHLRLEKTGDFSIHSYNCWLLISLGEWICNLNYWCLSRLIILSHFFHNWLYRLLYALLHMLLFDLLLRFLHKLWDRFWSRFLHNNLSRLLNLLLRNLTFNKKTVLLLTWRLVVLLVCHFLEFIRIFLHIMILVFNRLWNILLLLFKLLHSGGSILINLVCAVFWWGRRRFLFVGAKLLASAPQIVLNSVCRLLQGCILNLIAQGVGITYVLLRQSRLERFADVLPFF